MRLAIVAAASATDAAEPKLGERDAGLVRMRLGLDDLGLLLDLGAQALAGHADRCRIGTSGRTRCG